MDIRFAGNGKVLIDNARITWRNFAGRRDDYNRNGEREFHVIVDDPDIAEELMARGCNMRIKQSEDPNEPPRMSFKVKVSYRFGEPAVYLDNGRNVVSLTESSIGNLDRIDIDRVDLDIYFGKEWTVNGKTARTAYLDKIMVVQSVDRFRTRFAEEEYPSEMPFN